MSDAKRHERRSASDSLALFNTIHNTAAAILLGGGVGVAPFYTRFSWYVSVHYEHLKDIHSHPLQTKLSVAYAATWNAAPSPWCA